MEQAVHLPESWYEATAKRVALDAFNPGETEVCVLGGGLAGLTTALELARLGRSVTLLEASRVGAGASGRNGGFVSNGFALGYADLIARVGKGPAAALYELSRRGTQYVRHEIVRGDPTIKMGDGWILATRTATRGGLKDYAQRLIDELSEDVTYLPPAMLRERLDTVRYHDGLISNSAFHIHPLRYVLLLAQKGRAAGARIVEHCAAVSVQQTKTKFVVVTAQGTIKCRHVVHCTSAYGKGLNAIMDRAVLPVATYVAVSEPLRQDAIRTACAVSDTRRAGDYYRLIDEGRILWGGRITTKLGEPPRLAAKMRADMMSVYPQLGEPAMDYAWGGLMGYALHKMPLIGRDASGQWFATAFGGHGLNTTAMAGQFIASAIANGDEAYRCFSPFGPQSTHGLLGRMGVQGTYWWMQARDKWDESRPKPK